MYELSIWKDGGGFEEEKVAVIASGKRKTEVSAFHINMTRLINGDKILTFDLRTKYLDEFGRMSNNPFVDLIKSETKIKVRDGQDYPYSEDLSYLEEIDDREIWSDFIVKNVAENTETGINTYYCKEMFVNELGKNGADVLLSTELENNYGNLTTLGERVLEESGWRIGEDSIDPKEFSGEQLFVYKDTSIHGTFKKIGEESDKVITTQGNGFIYFFYSDVESTSDGRWVAKNGMKQLLWKGGDAFTTDEIDDSRAVIDPEFNYNYETVDYGNVPVIPVGSPGDPSRAVSIIRGNRLFQGANNHLEPVNDKYVTDVKVVGNIPGVPKGTKAYRYNETELITASSIRNFLVENNTISTRGGWSNSNRLSQQAYPFQKPKNNVVFPREGGTFRNSGPARHGLQIEGGQRFVLRIKARAIKNKGYETDYTSNDVLVHSLQPIRASIGAYAGGRYTPKTVTKNITNGNVSSSFDFEKRGFANGSSLRAAFNGFVNADDKGYFYTFFETNGANKPSEQVQVSVTIPNMSNQNAQWHIEDMQLFEYVQDETNRTIFPGEIPHTSDLSRNRYYRINKGRVEYLPSLDSLYEEVRVENHEAVRHIEVAESNYFNILNQLAELFGVWVKFRTVHRKDGRIYIENGKPVKEVVFTKYNPTSETNTAGFKYGKNLNGINRTIDSEAIATKVIVRDNNNEFAKDGSASIRRAIGNPSGEGVIYNFDYYLNQGLLDGSEVLRDLYGFSSTDLRLLPRLKVVNEKLAPIAQKEVKIVGEVQHYKELIVLSETTIDSIAREIEWQESILKGYSDSGIADKVREKQQGINSLKAQLEEEKRHLEHLISMRVHYQDWLDGKGFDTKYKGVWNDRVVATTNDVYTYGDKLYESTTSSNTSKPTDGTGWRKVSAESLSYPEQRLAYLGIKRQLNKEFNEKYHRFVQEGTWKDDSYIDDELYYFDAVKISASSAFPQVSYQIDVLDLSATTDYQYYKFKIGDETTLEDPRLFGYHSVRTPDGAVIKTPVKKRVVVTEETRMLDDPSQTMLMVQTYKNQYEDLFSQIVATTSQLQYSMGSYDRVANIMKPNGEIKVETLEEAFANNAFILSGGTDQTVVWDSGTGIEVTNKKNPSLKTRIIAGGIFLSNDGGMTWENGISGDGINTRFLTAGQINANKINIIGNEGDYSFMWDSDGLSAYNGQDSYVRYNNMGIFGTTSSLSLDNALNELREKTYREYGREPTRDEKEAVIREYTNFMLSWTGLHINDAEGGVSLSPGQGLEIFNNNWTFSKKVIDSYDYIARNNGTSNYEEGDRIPLITLGKFYDSVGGDEKYGLRMRNKLGYITLNTDDDGNLWLRNKFTVGTPGKVQVREKVSKRMFLSVGKDGNKRIFINGGDIDETAGVTINDIHYDIEKQLGTNEITILGSKELDETFQIVEYTRDRIETHNFGLLGGISEEDNDTGLPLSQSPIVMYAGYEPRQQLIDEEQGDPITTNSLYEPAPFKVYSSGRVVMEDADITGSIKALSGEFLGAVSIGAFSGIDGSPDAPFTFWSGSGGDKPTFYVKPDGSVYGSSMTIDGDSTFSGIIYAEGGYFKGEIVADTGEINRLYLNGSSSYIGAGTGVSDENASPDDLFINIDESFKVTRDGRVYGDKLNLGKVGDSYGISIGYESDYLINIKDMSDTSDNPRTVFGVKNDGSLVMSGDLSSAGDISLKGELSVGDDILINGFGGGSIYSNGWTLAGDGTAYFENVKVRGEISSAVFTYDNISSVGGELVISPSFVVQDDIPVSSGTFKLPDGINTQLWKNVDSALVNIGGIEYSANLRESDGKIVGSILGYAGNAIPKGTVVISTSTKANHITLSAKYAEGSVIEVNSPHNDVSLLGYLSPEKIPIEALKIFGDDINSEYGLFSSNAFITGKVYLPNVGLTNDDELFDFDRWERQTISEEDKRIRMWAGASPKDKSSAPFVVTHDGVLYARDGYFRGKINAKESSFEGVIKAAGVHLESEKPYNHFYISWDSSEDNPDNYIADFNRNGLNLWKGGLNIFSEYYNGIRESGQTSRKREWFSWETNKRDDKNLYYPETQSPFPVLTYLDSSDKEDFIPRLSSTAIQVWDFDETRYSSVNFRKGGLGIKTILKSDMLETHNYNRYAEELFNDDDIIIGYLDSYAREYDKEGYHGIEGNKIAIKTKEEKRLEVDELGTHVQSDVYYGDKMKVETRKNSVAFIYIGG